MYHVINILYNCFEIERWCFYLIMLILEEQYMHKGFSNRNNGARSCKGTNFVYSIKEFSFANKLIIAIFYYE